MKLAIFLIPVLALAACAPVAQEPDSPGVKDPVYQDIPMYPALTYTGYAQSTQAGHIRICSQEGKGQCKPKDVVSYYRSKLAAQDWVPAGEEGTNPVKMTFVKKLEQVVVEASSDGDVVKVKLNISGKK